MKWKERGMVSMINKDYFKYLIKQNKKYLILIYVIGIIIPFWMFNEHTPTLCTTGVLSLVYGLGLSCIIPIYLFSFLQKKNRTDNAPVLSIIPAVQFFILNKTPC